MNGNNEQIQGNAERPMSFEEAMDKLEQLVRSMESGNVKLEDMIKRFVEAKKLSAYCQSQLNALKEKIEILTNNDPNDPQYEEFHHESEQRADFIPAQNQDESTVQAQRRRPRPVEKEKTGNSGEGDGFLPF